MSESLENGGPLTNGAAAQSETSSDESNTSTVKHPSDSEQIETSGRDTDATKTSEPSVSELSELSDASCKDVDFKRSSPETSKLSSDEETVTEAASSSLTDKQAEVVPRVEQPSTSKDNDFSDHNNYADNEDSTSANIMKFQTMLENLRNIRKPKDIDIGKVINRRRRKRSYAEYTAGRNSPQERLKQRRRQQSRLAAKGEPYPQVTFPTSDSSQDTIVAENVSGPTRFSRELISTSDSERQSSASATEGGFSASAAEGDDQSAETSSTKTSEEPKDIDQNLSGDSSITEASQGAIRKKPLFLPSTSGSAAEGVDPSSDRSSTKTSEDTKEQNPAEDSSNIEASQGAIRKRPHLSSTSGSEAEGVDPSSDSSSTKTSEEPKKQNPSEDSSNIEASRGAIRKRPHFLPSTFGSAAEGIDPSSDRSSTKTSEEPKGKNLNPTGDSSINEASQGAIRKRPRFSPSSGSAAERVSPSSDRSNTKTSEEPKDRNPSEDTSNIEASQGAKRKRPHSLPSTSKNVCSPLSPLPTTPEDIGSPMQYPASLIISESLYGNPHASRTNSLVSLICRIQELSDHMNGSPLLSIPGPSPSTTPDTEVPPLLVRVGRHHNRIIRELEEEFRQSCNELCNPNVQNQEQTFSTYIQCVKDLKDNNAVLADNRDLYFSHRGTIVPASDDPLTLDEIRATLPILWNSLMLNNTRLSQWAYTLLDWCLLPTPEREPQKFYDAEATIRSLYREIADVHLSVHRLLNRWRSRRMDPTELGDLTMVSTLSGHALTLYSILEYEVNNIRYNLGTRQSRRRRRTETEETLSDEHGCEPVKKGRKE